MSILKQSEEEPLPIPEKWTKSAPQEEMSSKVQREWTQHDGLTPGAFCGNGCLYFQGLTPLSKSNFTS